MVLFTLAPYFVSYAVLGTLFQDRVSNIIAKLGANADNDKSKKECNCRWISFLIMCLLLSTPVSIIYFWIIDVVFMVYVLFSSVLFFVTCCKVNVKDWFGDHLFQYFGMNRMQVVCSNKKISSS